MADQETTTFDSSFAHELSVQSWSMYGVGMAIVALRMLVSVWLIFRPYCTDEALVSHGLGTLDGGSFMQTTTSSFYLLASIPVWWSV